MSALTFIWFVALALTGAALIVMAVLIVARVIADAQVHRRAARRRALLQGLLTGDGQAVDMLRQVPSDLLAETFTDIIRLVRGGEREAFVAQATELGVPAHLGRQLRSGSTRRRITAARSLAAYHDADSMRALHTSLSDRNDDVRLAAALSLADSQGGADTQELVEQLGLGVEEDSLLMVTLFRVIAGERPEEIKALVLGEGVNARVRLAGIEAIATTGDYTLVPVIAALALGAPDDAEELPRYLRALGALAHPAGAKAVLNGLDRSAMGARAAASVAAGKIGLTESAPRLAELLDDPEWWVRFRAAEALIRLGPPGVERLRTVSASGTPRASDAASTMLAEASGLLE